MKQLKFLMVAFTLLMGVSFTSCLNDDAGESMYDGIGYVRTVMGSYFVDLYGNTYHPTMVGSGFTFTPSRWPKTAVKRISGK